MAVIETWLTQDLDTPVKQKYLDGNLFSMDNAGNLIGVECFKNGAAATLAGSVTGYCVLADGTTVPVTGTRSGNKASIVIPQTALSVPGVIGIVIKLINGTTITTLASVVSTVYRTQTDATITPSQQIITDWSNQINAAIQQCEDVVAQSVKYGEPQSLEAAQKAQARTNIDAVSTEQLADLRHDIAPEYDSSATYTKGQYCSHNNNYYRAKQNISTAEEWTSSHWQLVKIGNDFDSRINAEASTREQEDSTLKSALSQTDETIFNGYTNNPPVAIGSFSASGVYTINSKRLRTNFIPVKTGDRIVIDNGSLKHACGAWENTLSTATNIRNDSTFNTNDEEITSPVNGYYIVVFAKQDTTQEIALSDFDGSVLVYANGMYRNAKAIDDANAKFNDFLYGASYSFTGKVSSTNKFDMPLFEGFKYTASNNTGAAISLNLYKANGTSKVVSSSLSNGSSIDFTVDAEDYTQIGGWFNAGSSGALVVSCNFSAIEKFGDIDEAIDENADNIADISGKLNKVTKTEDVNVTSNATRHENAFYNVNNQIYSNQSNWDYYTLPVSAGDNFTINTVAGGTVRGWAFRDSSSNQLSIASYYGDVIQKEYEDVTAPTDAVELIVNVKKISGYVISIIKNDDLLLKENKIIYNGIALPVYLDAISQKSNILYGKKLCCCGDSITYGADMDSPGIVTPTIESYQYSAYTKQWTRWTANEPAAYGYQIAERNNMIFYNGGVSGATVQGSGLVGSNVPGFSVADGEYTLLPENIDYLTLFYGWNDNAFGTLGTISDSTNASYYGGFNVVLPYLIDKYPYTKIGLIVPFGSSAGHREAVRQLADKWGVAVFDNYWGGTPLFYGKEDSVGVDSSIVTANRAKFQANGAHPNFKGHKQLADMIEHWMRGI